MNAHRPHSGCGLLAAIMLGLLFATLADGGKAAEPAAPGAPAATPTPASPAPAPAEAAAAPAAVTTATAKAPATMVIGRQAADVFLDLDVRAFKPPRRGAVEAVVTVQENKDGGREAEVGSFAIFPAKKFEARTPDDERDFRLDATQALADLGADSATVKVKVRLSPLHDGQSAAGAKLTLGKVQFVPRDEPKDGSK